MAEKLEKKLEIIENLVEAALHHVSGNGSISSDRDEFYTQLNGDTEGLLELGLHAILLALGDDGNHFHFDPKGGYADCRAPLILTKNTGSHKAGENLGPHNVHSTPSGG